jgi:hypothetical protein
MVLEKLGFEPVSYWLFKEELIEGQPSSDGLFFTPTGCKNVVWGYHVAAGVLIQDREETKIYILDPWTQTTFVTIEQWATSFFLPESKRTAFVFPVLGNYYFYPTEHKKLQITKASWDPFRDEDEVQMYCGLCGVTPNAKCGKSRNIQKAMVKKQEIANYLKSVL